MKEPKDADQQSLELFQDLQGQGKTPPLGLALDAYQNIDALFRGEGGSPPSTLILDYVYGVAAYNTWRSPACGVSSIMNDYREKHYADILPPPWPPGDDDNPPEPGDPDSRRDATFQ